jgi:two-component sensor histidine kinase
MATSSAMTILDRIRPSVLGLRQAIDDLEPSALPLRMDRRQCALRLEGLRREQKSGARFGVYDAYGRRVCASPRYSGLQAYPGIDQNGFDIALSAQQRLLRATIASSTGRHFGVAEFPIADIARFAVEGAEAGVGVKLSQGSQALILAEAKPAGALGQVIRVSTPVAGGQLGLEFAMPVEPVTAFEILLILLPVLMWAAGALIGWIVVERLLLHPLVQMQRAIAAFRDGDGPLAMPRLRTPAHELTELSRSFEQATNALTAHERELAEGLTRQKRLTREVHHRVKNNLQVVSSLISLHARGAGSPLIEEAYASIQRRVDALAVVHRHHYAEAEENFGVPLRVLLGEIASNLRGTLPFARETPQLRIILDLDPAWVTQDVAVPVALLATEILERALAAGDPAPVRIRLEVLDRHATLSFASEALSEEGRPADAKFDRFARIVTGLARQLRAPLEKDATAGFYAIRIPIVEPLPG